MAGASTKSQQECFVFGQPISRSSAIAAARVPSQPARFMSHCGTGSHMPVDIQPRFTRFIDARAPANERLIGMPSLRSCCIPPTICKCPPVGLPRRPSSSAARTSTLSFGLGSARCPARPPYCLGSAPSIPVASAKALGTALLVSRSRQPVSWRGDYSLWSGWNSP